MNWVEVKKIVFRSFFSEFEYLNCSRSGPPVRIRLRSDCSIWSRLWYRFMLPLIQFLFQMTQSMIYFYIFLFVFEKTWNIFFWMRLKQSPYEQAIFRQRDQKSTFEAQNILESRKYSLGLPLKVLKLRIPEMSRKLHFSWPAWRRCDIKNYHTKRGCVFSMVIWPAFLMGQYRVTDHPYHAPQFIPVMRMHCLIWIISLW